jgi:hypothetical protein
MANHVEKAQCQTFPLKSKKMFQPTLCDGPFGTFCHVSYSNKCTILNKYPSIQG